MPGNVSENPSVLDEPTASGLGNVYARSHTDTLQKCVNLEFNSPSVAEGAFPQNYLVSQPRN